MRTPGQARKECRDVTRSLHGGLDWMRLLQRLLDTLLVTDALVATV